MSNVTTNLHQRAITRSDVVDKRAAFARVLRMQSQPKQAALAAGEQPGVNVEKGRRHRRAGLQHLDDAALLSSVRKARVAICASNQAPFGSGSVLRLGGEEHRTSRRQVMTTPMRLSFARRPQGKK